MSSNDRFMRVRASLSNTREQPKLSLTNPSIHQAFELFNPSVLLAYKGCKPSKYFNRYGSYIEDISETIIRPALPRTITKDAIKVSKAFELYNDWIVNTNNLANAIQPQQALNSFIIVIILTVIIQIVYIAVMYKMFKVNTDDDGDDRPDSKQIFLTGFGGKDHDHVSALKLGPLFDVCNFIGFLNNSL